MAILKALVFDLDDTLYPEASYVRSGFHAVAEWFGRCSILPADAVFERLWSAHLRGERGRTFDDLLAAAQVAPGRVQVADLVRIYRSHEPDISLFPGMAALLDEARLRSMRIAIISDGFLEAQQHKVLALGLARWADPILLTDAWGREFWKPHARAFEQAQEACRARAGEIVYIGDNPGKDFQAPHALGWNSIHLVMPGQGPAVRVVSPARSQARGIKELRALLFGPGA